MDTRQYNVCLGTIYHDNTLETPFGRARLLCHGTTDHENKGLFEKRLIPDCRLQKKNWLYTTATFRLEADHNQSCILLP